MIWTHYCKHGQNGKMELPRLIDALAQPATYPHPVARIEIHHTHISVVFLAGTYAYKIKKPVDLGFLDFTTLHRRRHFCDEEVRLNRRLAPNVYLGVVPITCSDEDLHMDGRGDVVEWAVKMQRLPAEATLEQRLRRGEVSAQLIAALAGKIAGFHAHAESGSHISAFGRFEVVARNARENFEQAVGQVGITVSQSVLDRLVALTDDALDRLRSLIDERARRGVPRDTHGDLHLEHVYLFPERAPPDDLVIIDCIEFNERFRFADPVADMAFLSMDLIFHGRRDLAEVFAEEYFRAARDQDGRALLPLYIAYRAAVRGKVEGFELTEKEIPPDERADALARARSHWLLALSELEVPNLKPCLVLVGGLPGTGKSTLARKLAEQANLALIRSDVVRKELAGGSDLVAQTHSNKHAGRGAFGEGLYSVEWTDRTYGECLRRAELLLFEGKRVVVDATFGEERRRRAFLETAARLRVPAIFLLCRADQDIVEQRLDARINDVSDADRSIFLQAALCWEEIGPRSLLAVYGIDTNGTQDTTLGQALAVLSQRGLHNC
jgi:aminoglycoside phosphotransferase family enzyme/predicted kinase